MPELAASGPMGLVAGSGDFPLAFARALKATGRPVVTVAHDGVTDRSIGELSSSVTWVKVGQVGHVLDALKAGGCREAVMLGAISKKSFFDGARPDMLGLKLLAQIAVRSDNNLLRAIADEFERQGVHVVSGAAYLSELRAPAGVLGRAQPTPDERADVQYGFTLARNLGRFDVGQTVVVKDRAPIALEALEGTDACIERGGRLAKSGAVVVKVVKPGQDNRFDLPAAGSRTIEVCAAHKVRVLALQAGGTLLADRARMLALADRHDIVVMGVTPEDET
jgi:DUF1009 family protein